MKQVAYKKHIDHDPELEARTLGVFLAEPEAFGAHYNLLNEDCFFTEAHRQCYQVFSSLFIGGSPIDLLTVSRAYYEQGITLVDGAATAWWLSQLMTGVHNSAHLQHWCVLLRQLAARRYMVELTNSGFEGDDVVQSATHIEQKLKQLLDIRTGDDWQDTSQVTLKLNQRMEEARNKTPGIPTPFPVLNRLNGGFRAGNMIVLGARPSVGKSALAGQIGLHAAGEGYKVGIISLEMDNADIMTRLVSADASVDFWKIDRNILREQDEQQRVMNTMGKLSALPIYFTDKAQVNIHDIRAKAEKLKSKRGLDMLIIDYLQLVEPEQTKNSNREQEISKISRGVKLLAMSLQVPILMLAQLNREAADKEPELHHLRESGSIEQDADVVMFLHPVKDESGEPGEDVKLLVRKWRNGTPVTVDLKFFKERMKFSVAGS